MSRGRVFDNVDDLLNAGPSPSRGWRVTEEVVREAEADAASVTEREPGTGRLTDDRAWLLLIGVCLSLPVVLVAWIWAMVVSAA